MPYHICTRSHTNPLQSTGHFSVHTCPAKLPGLSATSHEIKPAWLEWQGMGCRWELR